MPITSDSRSVQLSLPGGPTVSVALLGATVVSYVSKGTERLFLSGKSSIEGPAAIRGGIPLCWPCFGPAPKEEPFAELKQHGFARTSVWTFDAAASGDVDDGVKAVLTLETSPSTPASFTPPFALTYTVHLTPTHLAVSLRVTSPTSTPCPLRFQALLHSYLRLPTSVTPPQVRVTPLGGLEYVDKVLGGAKGVEERAVVAVDGPAGEVDRVYFGAPDTLEVSYANASGGMEFTKTGLADVVLWNPGPAKGATIGDMEEGGADRYICLEPGQVGSFVELKAGESWEGGLTLAFSD